MQTLAVTMKSMQAAKNALLQAISAILFALILFLPACAFWQTQTPGVVQAETSGVIVATRIVVGNTSTGDLLLLNGLILASHNYLVDLAGKIQKGLAVLPTPDVINSGLLSLAAKIGNPVWALNMIGNLVTTYKRFYDAISATSPKVYAYVNAFALATV